tara:strand:+ start:1025 stop:1300 length:276 start_codon:yes stop_codon:yes gene_type:complete
MSPPVLHIGVLPYPRYTNHNKLLRKSKSKNAILSEGGAMSIPSHERNNRVELIIRDEAKLNRESQKTERLKAGLLYWLAGLVIVTLANLLR